MATELSIISMKAGGQELGSHMQIGNRKEEGRGRGGERAGRGCVLSKPTPRGMLPPARSSTDSLNRATNRDQVLKPMSPKVTVLIQTTTDFQT